MSQIELANLRELAEHVRLDLENKKYVLVFAYNGTGKTRLSVEFKNIGKAQGMRDTLYFNAYTEDLFQWNNDIDEDSAPYLGFNSASILFQLFKEIEREQRLFDFLKQYTDFQFKIDYDRSLIYFYKEVSSDENISEKWIKISRGEENLFIWCLFLVLVEAAVDRVDIFRSIKYLCIDDPISSLDENHAVSVANQLAQLLKREDNTLKTIITSHHTLFFNTLCNELGNAKKYSLNRNSNTHFYTLKPTRDTPMFYHVNLLINLYKAAQDDNLYTYHFSMLRSVMERVASFHGYEKFDVCLKRQDDDPDAILHARLINILSHGSYSIFDPVEMGDQNKRYFKTMLNDMMSLFKFNPDLF